MYVCWTKEAAFKYLIEHNYFIIYKRKDFINNKYSVLIATTCLKVVKIFRGKESKVQVHEPENSDISGFAKFCIDCFWISSKEILGNKWAPSNDKLMSDSKIIAWKAKDKSNSLEILFLIHYYHYYTTYLIQKIINY